MAAISVSCKKGIKVNHYGVAVDSKKPAPGIFQNNDAEWLDEVIDTEAIDLYFEEHLIECGNDDHDSCFNQDGSKYLVGFKKSKGQFVVDKRAPWSAIVDYDQWNHTTVLHSIWFYKGVLCSPCCPGQVSIGEPGRFLCYAPPPDMFSDDSEIAKAIFKKGGKK